MPMFAGEPPYVHPLCQNHTRTPNPFRALSRLKSIPSWSRTRPRFGSFDRLPRIHSYTAAGGRSVSGGRRQSDSLSSPSVMEALEASRHAISFLEFPPLLGGLTGLGFMERVVPRPLEVAARVYVRSSGLPPSPLLCHRALPRPCGASNVVEK